MRRRPLQHRLDSLVALADGVLPPDNIIYLGDELAKEKLSSMHTPQQEGVCFSLVIQKLAARYLVHDHGLYRRKAWSYCGLSQWQLPTKMRPSLDTVFLEEHAGTRGWADVISIQRFVMGHRISRGLQLKNMVLANVTYCFQVQLFARSKVVIMHHGAAVAGNAPFMAPGSVFIEVEGICPLQNRFTARLDAPCALPPVSQTSNQDTARIFGIGYVGAHVAIPVPRPGSKIQCTWWYYYESECAVQIDFVRFRKVLDTVVRVLNRCFGDDEACLRRALRNPKGNCRDQVHAKTTQQERSILERCCCASIRHQKLAAVFETPSENITCGSEGHLNSWAGSPDRGVSCQEECSAQSRCLACASWPDGNCNLYSSCASTIGSPGAKLHRKQRFSATAVAAAAASSAAGQLPPMFNPMENLQDVTWFQALLLASGTAAGVLAARCCSVGSQRFS
eukprot:CAMPEP_0172912340 /NCGR_PEP_ID=MMETSP1075-20121228/188211_1 /TAXON_ID=2916 /ORGANISM="Ceratium fusus, Strain PA161109" /LENGTH=449 /DNA_ID=CAMNT_0013770811 /DNA_START=45 /DNA_END=1391 /DNA_ORIENTATION=-